MNRVFQLKTLHGDSSRVEKSALQSSNRLPRRKSLAINCENRDTGCRNERFAGFYVNSIVSFLYESNSVNAQRNAD